MDQHGRHNEEPQDGQDQAVAPGGIVVGVDGSEHGQCALVWAAREAERRQLPLHIVTAYSVPIFAASGLDGGYATVDDSVIREGADAIVKQAMDKISGYAIDVDASVENGDAAGVLLDLSADAALLVFGSRGRGGFVGRLLGSVSSALPAHAKCPTVTVPLYCADRLGENTEDKHIKAEHAKAGPRDRGKRRCSRRRRLRASPRGSARSGRASAAHGSQAPRHLRCSAVQRFPGLGAGSVGPRCPLCGYQGPA